MIDKGVWDKGYIWNPSNCECECDKSCDVGEYLGYESCKCRKRLIDKLVEQCNEIFEEVEIIGKNKCSACVLYVVLFSIFSTINVGIATYFAYYKYMNQMKIKKMFLNMIIPTKQNIINHMKWEKQNK